MFLPRIWLFFATTDSFCHEQNRLKAVDGHETLGGPWGMFSFFIYCLIQFGFLLQVDASFEMRSSVI